MTTLRVGTWNLAGRWKSEHHELLVQQDVDVWLLTEVSERVEIKGYAAHVTEGSMAERRRWAGVFSRHRLDPLPDPHPASALARVHNLYFCSSVLPWRSAPSRAPWVGDRHADKTEAAVTTLLGAFPSGDVVWGGDWNHALSGPEHAGSLRGREHVLSAVNGLDLQVPTATLTHQISELLSIDHVAVPASYVVVAAEHVPATVPGRRLSDHDAYVVEVTR